MLFRSIGEGSISPYHREKGGDLTWELGSGYFGCRTSDGRFDPERFAVQAQDPQVRMIEIKISLNLYCQYVDLIFFKLFSFQSRTA